MKHKRQLKFYNHNDDDDDEADNNDSEYRDIESIGLEDLPLSETLLDGAEIFKRIRFLSRWENRVDSRGGVRVSVGDIHLWGISSHGVADMARFQMCVSICVHIVPYYDWIYAGIDQGDPTTFGSSKIWLFPGFVGRTRETSLPIIVLISNSKRVRRKGLRALLCKASGLAWQRFPNFGNDLSVVGFRK